MIRASSKQPVQFLPSMHHKAPPTNNINNKKQTLKKKKVKMFSKFDFKPFRFRSCTSLQVH